MTVENWIGSFCEEDMRNASSFIREDMVFSERTGRSGYQICVGNEFVILTVKDSEVIDVSCTCKHFDESRGCVHVLAALLYLFGDGTVEDVAVSEEESSVFPSDDDGFSFSSYALNRDAATVIEKEIDEIRDVFIDRYLKLRACGDENAIVAMIADYKTAVVFPISSTRPHVAFRLLDVMRDLAGSMVLKDPSHVFLPVEFEDLRILVHEYSVAYDELRKIYLKRKDSSSLGLLEEFLYRILVDSNRVKYSNPALIDMMNHAIEDFLTEYASSRNLMERLLNVNLRLLDHLLLIRDGKEEDRLFVSDPVVMLTGDRLDDAVVTVGGYVTEGLCFMLGRSPAAISMAKEKLSRYGRYGFCIAERAGWLNDEGQFAEAVDIVERSLSDPSIVFTLPEKKQALLVYAEAFVRCRSREEVFSSIGMAIGEEDYMKALSLAGAFIVYNGNCPDSMQAVAMVESLNLSVAELARFYASSGLIDRLSALLERNGDLDLYMAYGNMLDSHTRKRIIKKLDEEKDVQG